MHTNNPNEKRKLRVLFVITAALIAALAAPPVYGQRESGVADRALEKRAAEVTKMKNDFVAKVLIKEHIPFKVDDTGAVVLIQIEGKWEPVEKVEIVPVLRDDAQGVGIVAHELYFTTAMGIYRISSDIAIRK